MLRPILRGLTFLAKLPLKAGVYTCLLGLGAGLGVYGPNLLTSGQEALSWLKKGIGDSAFDPSVLVSPEKELDLIRDVRGDIEPRVRRAQILLRKMRTEREYILEKRKFIEERVPRVEGDSRSAEQILTTLAESVAKGNAASQEDRQLFESLGGPTWLALQERSRSLADSLADLHRLEQRVDYLQGKLEERRLVTLRYAPEAKTETNEDQTGGRKLLFPEIEESRELLQNVHEDLFKIVHALSPGLVSEAPTQAGPAVAKK